MDDCIFCKIVKGEIPSTKLFENEKVLSFLDIMPVAKGHALVIPKAHHRTLLDMSHEDLKEVALALQKVGAAVMKATKADGFNILQSNEKSAGQEIFHVHFHIIPRFEGDDLSFRMGRGKSEKEELEEYQKMIKKHI